MLAPLSRTCGERWLAGPSVPVPTWDRGGRRKPLPRPAFGTHLQQSGVWVFPAAFLQQLGQLGCLLGQAGLLPGGQQQPPPAAQHGLLQRSDENLGEREQRLSKDAWSTPSPGLLGKQKGLIQCVFCLTQLCAIF